VRPLTNVPPLSPLISTTVEFLNRELLLASYGAGAGVGTFGSLDIPRCRRRNSDFLPGLGYHLKYKTGRILALISLICIFLSLIELTG
jgi:hypothetical protein